MSVSVGAILERKGAAVHTIAPDANVAAATELLRRHDIGALVVSKSGEDVAGMLSERDITRSLATDGAGCLDRKVADIMSASVTTCSRDQTADDLMSIMTEGRIRHVPVVEDERLVGLVSIGDVVKSRIEELEVNAEALGSYVTGSAY